MSKYDNLHEEWISLYNEGLSIREISRQYNINKGCISYAIRKKAQIRPKNIHADKADIIYNLYCDGLNGMEIANTLDIPHSVVKRTLLNYGVSLSDKLRKYDHLAENFKEDYLQGMSLRKIAERYNVSRQTVSDYLKLNNTQTRNYSESSKKYKIIEDYFDSLTPTKAYYLGIIFASSKVYDINTSVFLHIGMKKHRKQLLLDTLSQLCNKPEEAILNTDKSEGYYVRINSKELCEKLTCLGLNKHLPNLEKFMYPFYLGFLTSNVYICKNSINIKCKEQYTPQIKEYFSNELGLKEVQINKSTIALANREDLKKLLDVFPALCTCLQADITQQPESIRRNYDKLFHKKV